MIVAETAIQAWTNAQPGLTGDGNPLSRGAYLRSQRSPADGAYAVLARQPGAPALVAEHDPGLDSARIVANFYAGTIPTAEAAAAAWGTAVQALTGVPAPCGDTGIQVLVSDTVTGPIYVPTPPDAGEQYCFQVSAVFTLYQP